MEKIKIFILIFYFIFLISFINAQNLTTDEQTEICLKESEEILNELLEEGFNVQRVNDSFRTASNLYEGQLSLKEKKRNYDFSDVFNYCNEIASIKENAYLARDEFNALKKFYDESFSNLNINTESVDVILDEIENEIETERYEKVFPLVEKAYQEIVNIQARHTTLNVFYEATARGVKRFFEKNWIMIVFIIISCLILFFIYYTTISKMIIKKKIEKLELRKKTLKEIIQQTQKDYFQHGKISEGTFNIKTKKLAELIRDIDRQIPLLQEELVKIGKKSLKKPGI